MDKCESELQGFSQNPPGTLWGTLARALLLPGAAWAWARKWKNTGGWEISHQKVTKNSKNSKFSRENANFCLKSANFLRKTSKTRAQALFFKKNFGSIFAVKC